MHIYTYILCIRSILIKFACLHKPNHIKHTIGTIAIIGLEEKWEFVWSSIQGRINYNYIIPDVLLFNLLISPGTYILSNVCQSCSVLYVRKHFLMSSLRLRSPAQSLLTPNAMDWMGARLKGGEEQKRMCPWCVEWAGMRGGHMERKDMK